MRRLAFLVALSLAVLSGCRRWIPRGPAISERHPNGLVVTLPRVVEISDPRGVRALSIEQTPNGFEVFLDRHKLVHHAISAAVDLHRDALAPGGAWPKERTVRGRLVHYAVTEEDGGNGGTLYTLRAWTPCPKGYVSWRQFEYAEIWRPNFDLGWALIDGTEPPQAAP